MYPFLLCCLTFLISSFSSLAFLSYLILSSFCLVLLFCPVLFFRSFCWCLFALLCYLSLAVICSRTSRFPSLLSHPSFPLLSYRLLILLSLSSTSCSSFVPPLCLSIVFPFSFSSSSLPPLLSFWLCPLFLVRTVSLPCFLIFLLCCRLLLTAAHFNFLFFLISSSSLSHLCFPVYSLFFLFFILYSQLFASL